MRLTMENPTNPYEVRVEWRPIDTAPLNRTILICDAHDQRVTHGTIILELDNDPSSERLVLAPGHPVTSVAWWTHWADFPPPPASKESRND